MFLPVWPWIAVCLLGMTLVMVAFLIRGIAELLNEPPESLVSLHPSQRPVRVAVNESEPDNTTAEVLEIV